MNWQKTARLAIAAFVLVFIAIVIAAAASGSRRRRASRRRSASIRPPSSRATAPRKIEKYRRTARSYFCSSSDPSSLSGRPVEARRAACQITADRNGRPFTVTSREAEVAMKGSELKTAPTSSRDVKMTSNDLEVAG